MVGVGYEWEDRQVSGAETLLLARLEIGGRLTLIALHLCSATIWQDVPQAHGLDMSEGE